jgi:putative ABC transport system permease protein
MMVGEGLWTDLWRALRGLGRSPGFAFVAGLTLALAIAANTAIFSVVYGVLLKPLPFDEPDRLVGIWHRAPGIKVARVNQGPANYFTYRDSNRVFEDVGVWNLSDVSITGNGEPERILALRVTDGMLPLLRVQPATGYLFNRADAEPDSPKRVILTHGYWQRRFGSRLDVVGQRIDIDGEPCAIAGVLPVSFKFLDTKPQILLPLQLNRAETFAGKGFDYQGIGRLKPGITLAQANADVARMIPLIFEQFPLPAGFTRQMLEDQKLEPNVRPLSEDIVGDVRPVLWTLWGTVGIVLLIACANVANLFLVRTEGRQHGLAVRRALGASRGRVARELLSESVVLSIIGGAVGLLFARAGLALLVWLAPTRLPRLDEIGLDPAVIGFTLALSIVAGLLFGLIPVMRTATPNAAALQESGRSSSGGRQRHRTRSVLVVSQVALALVLLIVSGLMIRTFIALQQVDPGFVRPDEVLTFRVSISEAAAEDPEQAARAHDQIRERLRQVPGVTSVGLSSSVTMDRQGGMAPIFVEGVAQANGRLPALRRYKMVGPDYVETMGNPVLAGRTITWTDVYQYAAVAVVSETFARAYWPQPADALGKRIRPEPKGPWREIIGIVGAERDNGLHRPATPIVYWPMLMKEYGSDPVFVERTMTYAIRSPRVQTPTFLHEVQQAVWALHPNMPLANVQTLEEIRAATLAQTSFTLVMLAIAAAGALLLGVVGLYAVIAYIATQRTREIGIRVALGAQTSDVRRLFLRHGMLLIVSGIAVGLAVSLAFNRLISSLLVGVQSIDVVTYAAVSAVLAVVALIATWLPARRASRIDPVLALRTDR